MELKEYSTEELREELQRRKADLAEGATLRAKFLSGYRGKELLKKHGLQEEGFWRVCGEDLNCDLGGHHHMPELGVFEGMLTNVVDRAVRLSGFWNWDSGGDITKVKPEKV